MSWYLEDNCAENILWSRGINVIEIHLHSDIIIFQVLAENLSTNMQWERSTMKR
jgi:hypothetical protein